MSKILLIIPTYNCKEQIERVLESIYQNKNRLLHKIIIIDNGSSDGTVKHAYDFIQRKNLNIDIFITSANRSLGGTHKLAFDFAIQNAFDYVAILHGDDQADVKDLESMCKLVNIQEGKISILGSRFSIKSRRINYSPARVVGNLILNSIYSLRFQKLIKDLGSGLNVFSVEQIKDIEYMQFADSLTFNYQLIISLILQKMEFRYFPMQWKEEDQKSNANNFVIFFTALRLILFPQLGKKPIVIKNSMVLYNGQ